MLQQEQRHRQQRATAPPLTESRDITCMKFFSSSFCKIYQTIRIVHNTPYIIYSDTLTASRRYLYLLACHTYDEYILFTDEFRQHKISSSYYVVIISCGFCYFLSIIPSGTSHSVDAFFFVCSVLLWTILTLIYFCRIRSRSSNPRGTIRSAVRLAQASRVAKQHNSVRISTAA